ncbi:hypothetical protein ACFYSC_13465 [Streptosporangium sp. NPDC004379]|uniref:arsenate reductase/protein-tyrosine-phosphatase family protein n=1 Tax=Streptosporangium sp. NPDC004379 TaxID=3366189 RepID=UPI00369CA510
MRAVTMSRDDAGFHILFVCTGNICRSPVAERLARSILGPASPIRVSSAGTHAEPGGRMAERARESLVRLGGDPGGFAARPLTPELVAAADLVLTAASEHRARAVQLLPASATRAFTIAEFGVLSRAVPPGTALRHRDLVRRAHTLVAEARALRGLVPVERPDIPDPHGGSRRAHRTVSRMIAEALAVPLRLLTHPRES